MKTDIQGIVKVADNKSGGGILINKDMVALKQYRRNKAKEFRSITVEKEIENLKSDINEIKELLKGLVK